MQVDVPRTPRDRRVANATLRSIRLSMRMSQGEFAAAVRHAGDALGEPNTCNKRLIQKWESGEHARIRPNYQRALQSVTHLPAARLGFPGGAVPPMAVDPTVRAGGSRPSAEHGGAESSDRMRFALDRPSGVDEAAVALAEATTAHLFDREHHEPARHLAAAVEQHTAEVAVLLTGARREGLRRRLASSGRQAAALPGHQAPG